MSSRKTIVQIMLGFALGILSVANAQAKYEPNDNYSSLILSFQSSKFATPICFNGDCHTGLAGPAGVYSYQVIPNLALGVAGSYLRSNGDTTSISSTNVSGFARVVVGLGSRFDMGGSVALLSNTTNYCIDTTRVCTTYTDSGTDYGIFGKVFMTDSRALSLMLSFNSIDYRQSTDQSIVALSLVGIVAKRHRFDLSVNRVIETGGGAISDGVGFGYSYMVF